MLKRLQEKAGFVSLETIIVTGVVIALGLYGLTQYQGAGKVAIDASVDKVTEVLSFTAPM
mgnify:CR=1 FL=1